MKTSGLFYMCVIHNFMVKRIFSSSFGSKKKLYQSNQNFKSENTLSNRTTGSGSRNLSSRNEDLEGGEKRSGMQTRYRSEPSVIEGEVNEYSVIQGDEIETSFDQEDRNKYSVIQGELDEYNVIQGDEIETSFDQVDRNEIECERDLNEYSVIQGDEIETSVDQVDRNKYSVIQGELDKYSVIQGDEIETEIYTEIEFANCDSQENRDENKISILKKLKNAFIRSEDQNKTEDKVTLDNSLIEIVTIMETFKNKIEEEIETTILEEYKAKLNNIYVSIQKIVKFLTEEIYLPEETIYANIKKYEKLEEDYAAIYKKANQKPSLFNKFLCFFKKNK